MCRFFFDRRDEQGIVTDDDGMLLSDLELRTTKQVARSETLRETRRGGLNLPPELGANWQLKCATGTARNARNIFG